jgi:hypothetical protein
VSRAKALRRAGAASETDFAADVEDIRAAWADDTTLPIDDCAEPDIAFTDDLPVCEPGGPCTNSYFLGETKLQPMRLVIRAELDPWTMRQAVLHEAVHWLSVCTGQQRTRDASGALPWINGDAAHRDPRLWGPGGVLQSVW